MMHVLQIIKGNQPIDVAIHPDGAPACFSNLPVKAMTEAIKSRCSSKFIEYRRHICLQSLTLSIGYLADKYYLTYDLALSMCLYSRTSHR